MIRRGTADFLETKLAREPTRVQVLPIRSSILHWPRLDTWAMLLSAAAQRVKNFDGARVPFSPQLGLRLTAGDQFFSRADGAVRWRGSRRPGPDELGRAIADRHESLERSGGKVSAR